MSAERARGGASVDAEHVVRRFVDAFNDEDIDALAATVSENVEIQGGRGLIRGRDEARAWATRVPIGELDQRLVLDEVRSEGHPTVALIRRQWWWSNGQLADEQELGVLVTVDERGLISGYHPLADRAAALRVAGLDA